MTSLDTITRDYAAAQRKAWGEYQETCGRPPAEGKAAVKALLKIS